MSEEMSVTERLFSVRGLRVLVTGGASGIGYAIAEVLVQAGALVTVVDIDAPALEQARASLTANGASVRARVADVADEAQIRAAVDELGAELGGVDVVFANAGLHRGVEFADEQGELENFSDAAWAEVIDVNLSGAFFTLQAAAAHMKSQGSGRIIVTASTAGMRSDPFVGYSYVAAKAGLINASRQAAFELAPFGISVNVIAPGPFRTNIGRDRGTNDIAEERWAQVIPMGRMADTEEIKGLALLLSSSASSFMTGAVIAIDGGALTAQHPVPERAPIA